MLTQQIIASLKPLHPHRVILFGSYAWGQPDENSDLDIYVVTQDDFIPQSWREKADLFLQYSNVLSKLTAKIPTDLIVHTKKMHTKFIAANSSFARKIQQEGIILYES
jgi:uncharacterized protein